MHGGTLANVGTEGALWYVESNGSVGIGGVDVDLGEWRIIRATQDADKTKQTHRPAASNSNQLD